MKDEQIHDLIRILSEAVKSWDVPIVTMMSIEGKDPFRILIATVLSLRTKDETTAQAAARLFARASTPREMLRLSAEEIEDSIYPVGFYRTKARNILEICRILVEKFDGRVPDEIETLLTLPGVGRKTANLVVTHGYGKPGICVDTHVHRISNRLGYVKTKTPRETEFALREKLPKEYWIRYNDLLVSFGQHLCKPVSPHCSVCPVARFCDRMGVERSR
ncbi:MAG: endonuclease III [Deltaproteobacteria bacterium]|nr:MAG: endonuclease III [Deltaproteobacteria bacterium]